MPSVSTLLAILAIFRKDTDANMLAGTKYLEHAKGIFLRLFSVYLTFISSWVGAVNSRRGECPPVATGVIAGPKCAPRHARVRGLLDTRNCDVTVDGYFDSECDGGNWTFVFLDNVPCNSI